MPSPRFILILSAHSNLLRAALVTRDQKIVASAQQPFQITDGAFDPAEVWYKTKKVIAACLDIGRTLSREITGVALVTDHAASVVWYEQDGEIISRGCASSLNPTPVDMPAGFSYKGTLAAWLLWNLTGAFETTDFGKTHPRAPFDAELPVLAVIHQDDAMERAEDTWIQPQDRAVRAAAQSAWRCVPQ